MSDPSILDDVDPFVGTEPVDVQVPDGLASTWFFPKPMIGNTHPGATLPFGMVSACAYSGGYPTGYGRWGKCTEGLPPELFKDRHCTGFTHFHPSGVGAIRKYYNYVRVVPTTVGLGGLSSLNDPRPLIHERARPGYYACELGGTPIQAELSVTSRGAVHRYTFLEDCDAVIAIDLSHGGIAIEDGQHIPQRAHCELTSSSAALAEVVLEGVSLCSAAAVRYYDEEPVAQLWHGDEVLEDEDELAFKYIRPSTFKPFGVLFTMPVKAGHQLELRIGFSWRSPKSARKHLPSRRFEVTAQRAGGRWLDKLEAIEVEGGTDEQRRVLRTSQYRSLIKPCEAHSESPFWPWDGPFYFDMSTMWDLYKTQLPLAMSLYPDFASDFINALLSIVEVEGNFPIGYRMARGYDRFAHQACALSHVTIADALTRGIEGIDWERAATLMARDLSRGGSGEAFMQQGLVHPITHTLDLAYGCYCTARVAQHIGDGRLQNSMLEMAGGWVNAFDQSQGLLKHSTFYEGGRWNYSFRFLHDMPKRIEISGGTEGFVAQLDRFFGYGANPCIQVGRSPMPNEMRLGHDLHRFEGLCNEPDMEVPYTYCFAGRHDRTCEVVREGLKLFTPTPGGMVGNDDSGAMTSWYIWSSLGLFPVAGQDLFIIGSPVFTRSIWHLPGGDLTINAPDTTDTNRYVTKARLNGRPLDKPFLSWKQLVGGTIDLKMSDQPSAW
ncbi:MAG: glycoside hydrolase domain-containing protein [Planctomycetota bacterium]